MTDTERPIQPTTKSSPQQHRAQKPSLFDIVVPVYNSMHHVRPCIESVLRHSTLPFHLYVVDDHSDDYTREELTTILEPLSPSSFTILRNDTNRGHLRSSNRGVEAGSSPYVILLDSDAIVTPGYLERVRDAFEGNPRIGIINPVSTWANWTRIPFPDGFNIHELSEEVREQGTDNLPDIFNASGFFFAVRRELFTTLGTFDRAFDPGYYEEADFCFRAVDAGWRVVVDDRLYIYHYGWGSFEKQGRDAHMQANRGTFLARWAEPFLALEKRVLSSPPTKELQAHLSKPRLWRERERRVASLTHSETPPFHPAPRRKIVYILPAIDLYGGIISVLQIVNQLVLLGYDANVAVYGRVKDDIERLFPLYFRPYIFPDKETLIDEFPRADVVVATHWETVTPAVFLRSMRPQLELLYFCQDFEPDFYEDESRRRAAERTYRLIPRKIVKTRWLREKLQTYGGEVHTIPLGINLDIFHDLGGSRRRQVISMVRTSSARRNFPMIKAVFEELHRQRPDLELAVFGSGYRASDFCCPVTDYGSLGDMRETARALNESLVLLDCSTFQGFGRPGLEAMACAAAAVVTREGGITQYAKHLHNCLLINPLDRDDIVPKILKVVDDEALRTRLVENGRETAREFSLLNEGKRTAQLFDRVTSSGHTEREERARKVALG